MARFDRLDASYPKDQIQPSPTADRQRLVTMISEMQTGRADLMFQTHFFVVLGGSSIDVMLATNTTEIQLTIGEFGSETSIQRHSRIIDMKIQFFIPKNEEV